LLLWKMQRRRFQQHEPQLWASIMVHCMLLGYATEWMMSLMVPNPDTLGISLMCHRTKRSQLDGSESDTPMLRIANPGDQPLVFHASSRSELGCIFVARAS
ncbi:hypothetical protein EDD15DRAFT_2308525, partial [Pisolithus albus]